MSSFTDTEGRTWTVELTYGSAKRVKKLVGVDLLAIEHGDPPLLTRLGTEIMLVCDVIFALIKPQADEQGVSDEEWAEAMGGDAITEAHEALYEAIVNFFRSRGRTDVGKAVAKQKSLIDETVKAGTDWIDGLDATEEARSIYGGSATGSEESAG